MIAKFHSPVCGLRLDTISEPAGQGLVRLLWEIQDGGEAVAAR
jgi:hypothetical protein